PAKDRCLSSSPHTTVDLSALGAAGRLLQTDEQIDLLTRTAMAALRAEKFKLMRDCVRLGQRIAEDASVPVARMLRLRRSEIDLGILYAGNPEIRNRDLRNPSSDPDGGGTDRCMQWVIDKIAELRDQIPADEDEDNVFARGKLALRLAEAEHLRGDLEAAG